MAAAEDLDQAGDITSMVCIDASASATATFHARKHGRLAGAVLLARIARHYGDHLTVTDWIADGEALSPGDAIASISGPLRDLLSAERVMLNFVCRLSGIATLTARYVEAAAGTRARIFDTRKTTPGYRGLEKYAVRCGGGHCHRIGLYDAVLIKDNHVAHLAAAGFDKPLDEAIRRARALKPPPAFIEVEVDRLDQLRSVLTKDVDMVLLDNMDRATMREAVKRRDQTKPGIELEASGGVNLDTVGAIAGTGVDRISVGALTHSAPALDIGLDMA
ncbi:MAG: carboxylating nicotinate-nucleotide diphosphorylase [Planctomycetes bacterium]|nr:carboxylating nicotinate-nucleotide diphosphorylase [Planctomycetota bacterium]